MAIVVLYAIFTGHPGGTFISGRPSNYGGEPAVERGPAGADRVRNSNWLIAPVEKRRRGNWMSVTVPADSSAALSAGRYSCSLLYSWNDRALVINVVGWFMALSAGSGSTRRYSERASVLCTTAAASATACGDNTCSPSNVALRLCRIQRTTARLHLRRPCSRMPNNSPAFTWEGMCSRHSRQYPPRLVSTKIGRAHV